MSLALLNPLVFGAPVRIGRFHRTGTLNPPLPDEEQQQLKPRQAGGMAYAGGAAARDGEVFAHVMPAPLAGIIGRKRSSSSSSDDDSASGADDKGPLEPRQAGGFQHHGQFQRYENPWNNEPHQIKGTIGDIRPYKRDVTSSTSSSSDDYDSGSGKSQMQPRQAGGFQHHGQFQRYENPWNNEPHQIKGTIGDVRPYKREIVDGVELDGLLEVREVQRHGPLYVERGEEAGAEGAVDGGVNASGKCRVGMDCYGKMMKHGGEVEEEERV
ncbi:hypothetical protein MBLNU230_g8490t1 [Neophaeotheca triangularis]